MLRETSIASAIVMYCAGRVSVAVGRAMVMIAAVSASRKSAGGMCRRSRCPGPRASRIKVRLA